MASSAQPPVPAAELVAAGLNDGQGPIPFAGQISVTHDFESFQIAIEVTPEPSARWAQGEDNLLAAIEFVGESQDSAADSLGLSEVHADFSLQVTGRATWADGAIALTLQMSAQFTFTEEISLAPGTPPVSEQSGNAQLFVTAEADVTAKAAAGGGWSWTASGVSLPETSPISSGGARAVDFTGAMDGLSRMQDLLGVGAASAAQALVAALNAPRPRASEARDTSFMAKAAKTG